MGSFHLVTISDVVVLQEKPISQCFFHVALPYIFLAKLIVKVKCAHSMITTQYYRFTFGRQMDIQSYSGSLPLHSICQKPPAVNQEACVADGLVCSHTDGTPFEIPHSVFPLSSKKTKHLTHPTTAQTKLPRSLAHDSSHEAPCALKLNRRGKNNDPP